MNSSKVVIGILGGFATVALIGVLFAPHKGCRTRKKIIRNSKDFSNTIKGKFEELYDDVTDTYANFFDRG
jgi:gas vesicle protein